MRILLIRLSSIGDIVLQTPVASWLKQEFPQCHITFLTTREFTCILEGHPHIDNVIGMERFRGSGALKKLFAFSREVVKKNEIDLIIDLHDNTRSRLIGWFNPEVKLVRIDKRKLERKFLVKTKINLLKDTPSIHWRNIQDIAAILGKKFDRKKYQSFMQSFNPKLTATSLAGAFKKDNFQEKKIIFGAMASFAPKRWPVAKFSSLLNEMLNDSALSQYRFVILGGKEDSYLSPLQEFELKYPERVEYLQGKTSLTETIEQIKNSSLCIGNDTGVGHIAEAYGISSIVIFGPTTPSFGFGTHGNNSKNIFTNEKCSPCSTLGKSQCKFQTQYCMDKIEVDSIKREVLNILRDS